MFKDSLITNQTSVRTSNSVASGTTDVVGTAVDMDGHESVRHAVLLGAVGASGGTVKAQQSPDSATWTDVPGCVRAFTSADGTKIVVVEVIKPSMRYQRCSVLRPTAAVVDGILTDRGHPRAVPATQPATTLWVSVTQGT